MELNHNQHSNTEDKILGDIKDGKIKMKPRLYFIAKGILLGFAFGILLLLTIYLASFIIFSIRISGIWFLPFFGNGHFSMILATLPWVLITLAILAIVTLEISAKKFRFVYQKPIAYSLLAITSGILLLGLLVGLSPFHARVFHGARQRSIPLLDPVYHRYGSLEFQNVYNGIVSQIISPDFTIITPRGNTLTVTPPDNNTQIIEPGNFVIIIGKKENNHISADEMQIIEEDENFFPVKRENFKKPKPFEINQP